MTRINCIDIEELTREHCFAEYREMTRLRHLWPRKKFPGVTTYCMGSGHVLFFADKGLWLEKRHQALYDRLTNHFGYRIKNIPILNLDHWPPEMMNDWVPSEDDMRISRGRIDERLKD